MFCRDSMEMGRGESFESPASEDSESTLVLYGVCEEELYPPGPIPKYEGRRRMRRDVCRRGDRGEIEPMDETLDRYELSGLR